MHIFLIDGIGPFFRHYKKRQINWSKIPFHSFPKDREELTTLFDSIVEEMETFAQQVSAIGYNSITLDDVAHLTQDQWLEPEINLTMDILSLTPALKEKIGTNRKLAHQYLQRLVNNVLTTYPEIRGLILRIGECDGKDVKGFFRSELLLKTPKQVNRMLKELLPVFEQHNRLLILRTWTVGAYPIGDFIWHRGTSSNVLHGIDSKNFILSMKYGESDFFRFLPLNKHFFRLKVPMIIELQAKREYEGCGEYPSFIGWDYQQYAEQLQNNEYMVGMCVWCQTGGWVPFRRLSYLEDQGLWNELNSYVCLKIFKEQLTVEQAVYSFCKIKDLQDVKNFLEFLRLNDEAIKELLYIKPFAEQKLFFRRVRIPPLLSVYWNNIFINHSVRKILRSHVDEIDQCVQQSHEALEKIRKMKELAKELDLPTEDITYMYDTFHLLVLAREYYFLPYHEERKKQIQKAKKRYKKNYPKSIRPRYRVKTNFEPFTVRSHHLRWASNIMLRKKRGYRVLDKLLILHFLGFAYKILIKAKPDIVPKFARKHAMGIETIFK